MPLLVTVMINFIGSFPLIGLILFYLVVYSTQMIATSINYGATMFQELLIVEASVNWLFEDFNGFTMINITFNIPTVDPWIDYEYTV